MRLRKPLMLGLILLFTISVFAAYCQAKTSAYAGQTPIASFTYTPSAPTPEDKITFDASASFDPDGWITKYTWDFGDGSITVTTDPVTTHLYPIDSTYTVELTVTDNSGLTGTTTAVVEVSTVAFFRVCVYGTTVPIANVQVTAYYYDGSNWIVAPVGYHSFQIKYDNMTQPDLADTTAEKYRNPGYTASILRYDASNIGFDLYPSNWKVYFKFQWGSVVAYWPNDTTRVYSYNHGTVESHDYLSGHKAYWSSAAQTYVIRVGDIPGNGVSPSECHPIIVGLFCPPPQQNCYLTVKTDPLGTTTIPGEGWYTKDSNVTLTAPSYVNVSATTRYKFNYWDVDGTPKGSGVDPIIVFMNANHTATAHYITQYYLTVNSAYGTIGGQGWYDSGSTVYATVTPLTVNGPSGTRYMFTQWSGDASGTTSPSNPITMSGPKTATAGWKTQYYLTVSSAYDSPTPTSGWFDSGAGVDASVTSPAAGSAGTQYVCTGWTGTGSVPSSGSGKAVTFIIAQPSNITWNWKTQYYLTVNSAYGTIGGQGWYDSGSAAYATVSPLTVAGPSGVQYVFTQWSGDASGAASPSNPITMNGPKTATANWKTQYYLTVNSAYGTVGGQDWYDSDTTAYATVTPLTVPGGSGTRYVFTSWSGDASGTTSPSNPITMNGPKTATASWKTQCYLTVSSARDSPTPASGWFDSGAGVNASVTSPAAGSAGTQYVCTGWTGTGSVPSSGSGTTVTFTITQPSNITWNWKTQYYLTVNSAYGTVGGQGWYDSGTSAYATVTPLTVSGGSGVQYVFTQWSGDASGAASPSNPITMNGPKTATASWKTQYYLTVNSAYGTVGGQGWYDSGASAYASVSPLTVAGSLGTQYVFTSWSGDASGNTSPSNAIVMGGPKTATANWKTQCYLTVSSAYDSPTPASGWFDSGAGVNASVTSPAAGSAGTQYVCTGWTGTGSVPSSGGSSTVAFTMNAPSSITWNWKTQYQVIFDQSGVGSDFTGAIVSIDYANYSRSGLPTTPQFWWDQGSNHSFSFVSPLAVNGGKSYVWNSTSGLSSLQSGTLAITTSGSVVGNYFVQNSITFDQSGVGSDFTDTIVIIDGVNYNRSQLPASFSWTNGSLHTFAYQSPLIPGANTKYVWTSTTGLTDLQNGSITVTTYGSIVGNYKTQYYLTVNSAYGTVGGQGWYDSGSAAYATVTPLTVAGPSGVQYVFTQWSGDASGSTSPSNAIAMSGPKTATANWKTQYYLTVNSAFGTVGGQGWYDSGSAAYATVTPVTVSGGSGVQYVFTQWSGDASGSTSPSNAIAMSGPKTATASWKTQYYLTVSSAYDSPTPASGWFDSGAGVNASVTSPAAGSAGTQYVCTGWTGTGSVPSSGSGTTVTFTITQPSNITWNWKTQYYLTVNSAYGTVGGQGWYDSGSAAYATVTPVTVSGGSGVQYVFTQWSGDASGAASPSNPITMSGPKTATANWKTQYYLTVSSAYSTVGGQGWYDSGSAAYASVSPLTVPGPSGTQYVFTSWSGDASGTTSPSNPITMNGPKTATANWKTQYYLTVNSGYGSTGGQGWYDSGTSAYATVTPLTVSGGSGVQYVFTQWSGDASGAASPSNPITMNGPKTATASWKTQYYLTVSSPYGSVDGQGWYDSGSAAYATVSPLTVPGPSGTQYVFTSWSGDASGAASPSNPITMSGPKTATASWKTQYYLTVNSAYGSTGGQGWYDSGTSAYATVTPLTVSGGSGVQYVFTQWSGDASGSTSPSNPITMSGPKAATANWKTQYYLTMATSPPGVDSPSGAAWYDAGDLATISSDAFVDIVSGSSRYRFNGWTTANMTEIADPAWSPTTVIMDEVKTVTANYITQYNVTFRQAGASSDFTGTIVTIDGVNYNVTQLQVSFWWDASSSHTFAYQSPLLVTANVKQYVWTSTSGMSTSQNSSITVTTSGSVTGTYKTQYYLTNNSSYGSPAPAPGWFDTGTLIIASVTSPWQGSNGTRYVCKGWNGTGSVPPSGTSPSVTFTISQASGISWNWKTQYLLTVVVDPSDLSPQPTRNPQGEAGPPASWWYDAPTTVVLTAQNITGYAFSYWDFDGIANATGVNPIIVVINPSHTATAHYLPLAPTLTVSISPLLATINLGQSVSFIPFVSGGVPPYTYQWYVNGNPVPGANPGSWTFTPASTGTFYVYLNVTASNGYTAVSQTAKVTVLQGTPAVGGYSISLAKHFGTTQMAAYATLIVLFGAILSLTKRKRK